MQAADPTSQRPARHGKAGRRRDAVRFSAIAVDDVLSWSVDAVCGVAAERNVTIDVAASAERVVVRADPDRLIQILVNCCPTRFAFPRRRTVQLSMRSHFDAVTVSVRDNGAGALHARFARHLFGRFAPKQPAGVKIPARRTGLSSLASAVRSVCGRMAVKSGAEAPGGGAAQFSFDLAPMEQRFSAYAGLGTIGLPRLLWFAGALERRTDAIVQAICADRQVRAIVVADLAAVRTAARAKQPYVALVTDRQCAEVERGWISLR